MPEAFYRVGQTAKLLKVSTHHVRRLCETALIEAEVSEGGQWKISLAEVQRLQKSGVPPIPERLEPHNGRGVPVTTSPAPGLIAEPSPDVVAAHEQADIAAQQVEIRRNKIEGLKLHKEAVVLGDFFRARRREREEAAAAEREAAQEQAELERQRVETERCRQARAKRDSRWLVYALNALPYEAQGEVETELHEQVRAALSRVRLGESDTVVHRIVDAVTARVLKPWQRRKEIRKAVEEASDTLPYQIKGTPWSPTEWEVRGRAAAAKAIGELRPDASYGEMVTAGTGAVRPIIAQYEAQEAAEADQKMRQDILRWASLPAGLTQEGRELAAQAIVQAIAALPLGTPRRKLEEAAKQAMAPFREAVARYQQQQVQTQQEQAERERQAESQRRDAQRQQQAKIEEERAQQVRRQSEVEAQLRANQRQQFEAGLRLSSLRSWIFDELHRFEQQGQLDELGFNERWRLAGKLEENIRPPLIDRLLAHPDLSDDQIKKKVRRLVDEHLDEVLQPVD